MSLPQREDERLLEEFGLTEETRVLLPPNNGLFSLRLDNLTFVQARAILRTAQNHGVVFNRHESGPKED